MGSFEYNTTTMRVVFGQRTLDRLPDEVARLKVNAPLLLSTPEQVSQALELQRILGGRVAGIFSEAAMHTPISTSTKALEYASLKGADGLISIGGGSTIGLGKAISIRTGLPHICIPTTYAGSEMTPILGETLDGKKTTRNDPKIFPGSVIYDVDLTLTLPAGMSATSGVNAIAHAVEALYARNGNPIISLFAVEGIKSLAASLPLIVTSPTDISARKSALYGAWLCGTCLGAVGMSLHHKLCHTLGGSFNMPHAEVHTIILPHALAYNAPNIPGVLEKLAKVLPPNDGGAIKGLNMLLESLNVRRALKDFGFKEESIAEAAKLTLANPYWNPRALELDLITELLRRAWAGEDARADL
ncbi:maleylacetate reductase [Bisporella sp. PMI_857]|nr:maleylacetate reductase [Bisporella sp. PMI_857]